VDKQDVNRLWDQIRQKYGVYLRLLDAIPDEAYQTHPVAGIRTPAEMVAHVSGSVLRDVARGVAEGEIRSDESVEPEVARGITDRAAATAFALECWDEAARAVEGMGDEELSAIVPTPWGMAFPGWVGFHVMNDELLHHRGQLFAYARLLGVEPPFIYGYEDNPPGFGPAA